jgi:RNA polymerase sigma-70 factor, ECF subfamily
MFVTSVTLLDRLKEPDSPAWPRFVSLYTPLIHHWARQFGLRTDDASDLVQDVLFVTVRRLPTFEYRDGASFRGWLRTVTLNHWKRYRSVRTPLSVGELAELPDPACADSRPEEDREYAKILVTRGLELIRNEFSDASWSAFQLHVLQAMTAEETATKLGIRIGTVYAAKSRILARLREVLAGLVEWE